MTKFSSKWRQFCFSDGMTSSREHTRNKSEQNCQYFADDIFICILSNENDPILNKISLKFAPKGPIDNESVLVQLLVWRWSAYICQPCRFQAIPRAPNLVITVSVNVLTWQNGRHLGRRHFQLHFLESKRFNSYSKFTEICSYESNWQYTSIGSDNGLAPNRPQSITWTNDDLVHWRIYVALGRD